MGSIDIQKISIRELLRSAARLQVSSVVFIIGLLGSVVAVTTLVNSNRHRSELDTLESQMVHLNDKIEILEFLQYDAAKEQLLSQESVFNREKRGYEERIQELELRLATTKSHGSLPIEDSFRISLWWDAPSLDLDAHLFFGEEHVFYKDPRAEGVLLNNDATRGPAAEAIEVEQRQQDLLYLYVVTAFPSSDPSVLSRSGAKVDISGGSLTSSAFTVPEGTGDKWVVFSVDHQGTVNEINRLL
jgi:hypothetical protein